VASEYEFSRNKVILITGGTGSLGRALVHRLCRRYDFTKVIIFSRDEFKQHQMQQEFPYENLRYFLGDIRDKNRLAQACHHVDYLIHGAALKQIPALEYNPGEAIKTNIIGTMNVVETCISCGVERATLVSTDKAVEAVNLYGSTKACAEKYFLAANTYNKTRFNVVRYGNVLGSRGSVVSLFDKLIEKGQKRLPLTDKKMTRFWITLDEAVDLVLFALDGSPDNIYIPNASASLVTTLARALCSDCTFEEIGVRPGEKLHEILASKNEKKNIFLLDKGEAIPYTGKQFDSKTCVNQLTVKQLREKINDIHTNEIR